MTSFEIIHRNSNKHYICKIPLKTLLDNLVDQPKCQRNINSTHVRDIIAFQETHHNEFGEFFFPTPLVIGFLKKRYYLIDGQHRLASMTKLLEPSKMGDFDVLVSLILLKSEEELDAKYVAINQNTPVPLPTNMNEWKQFGRHVERYMLYHFSKYVKCSTKPHTPNFNCSSLMLYLNENKVASRIHNDHELFLKELNLLNIYYKETYTTSIVPYFKNNIMKKIIKSKKNQPDNPLFLTLYQHFEWVERILYKITQKKPYNDMKHTPKNYRLKIHRKLRLDVWKKRNGDALSGQCYVCSKFLEYCDFQCGHITSVFYGGNTDLDNLEPICATCNNDMGVMNLNEYKDKFYESKEWVELENLS